MLKVRGGRSLDERDDLSLTANGRAVDRPRRGIDDLSEELVKRAVIPSLLEDDPE